MRLLILFLLTTMLSCTPKISIINSTSQPNSKLFDQRFITPEKVYYFFENSQWVEGVPDSIDASINSKDFLMETYRTIYYPAIARESGIQGIVLIEIEQAETGQLISSKIKQGIGGGCEEEALRVIQLAGRKQRLTPITKNGIPMRTKYDLPVRFKFE